MKSEQHKKTVLVGSIILLLLIISGIIFLVYWIGFLKYVSTDDASIECSHVSISSKIMGRISYLTKDEGDNVESGQLLVQLDDAELQAQEVQSNASLNYAKQNVTLSKINLEKIEEDYKRTKAMYVKQFASKEEYDHAFKAVETARTQYSLALVQVETADAQLGIIRTQLLNTQINSSISGVIAEKNAMQGEVVQPGQSIYLVNNLKDIWITANFEETKIRHIHPDESVTINVDAYPNYKFNGKVIQIIKAIVPPPFTIGESTKTTQKIPVKILFNDIPDSVTLLPGMSVEVKIKVK
jgi:membrane fusion protein (multidrug efflux system)